MRARSALYVTNFWMIFNPKIAFWVEICIHFGHFLPQKGTKSLKQTPKKSTNACIRARKAFYETFFDHKCIQKVIKCLYACTKCTLRDEFRSHNAFKKLYNVCIRARNALYVTNFWIIFNPKIAFWVEICSRFGNCRP
jgi:hypothetical protein